MNKTMKVSIEKIRKELEHALQKRGLAEEMISVLANDYLEGELQGKQSHGLLAFPAFLELIPDMKGKNAKIIMETHAYAVMDADTLPGAYVGRILADMLVNKAEKEGVAVGCIKNMKSWLRPAIIAQHISDKGMIGLVINNGGVPMLAPPGGYDPVIGTNPIGIGIPSENAPILIDMATSKRAWGEVRKAKADGSKLPEKTFYTKTGEYTVDPDDAYSVEAMGDYKGFALGLFIEIMTGSFLGRGFEKREKPDTRDYQIKTRGAMIMVWNPSLTTSLDVMKHKNQEFTDYIKTTHRLIGTDEILMPGERAMKAREKNLKNGYLEIDDKLWETIMR